STTPTSRALTCPSTATSSASTLTRRGQTTSTGRRSGGLRTTWVSAPRGGPAATPTAGGYSRTTSTRTTAGRPTGCTSSARASSTNSTSACGTTRRGSSPATA